MKKQMLSKMLMLATQAHLGQFDRGGKPYILHPLKVMHYLRNQDDEELLCIALGHDLFEDTTITPEFLRSEGFTERVIYGIDSMTKKPGQTYEEYKAQVFSNRDSMMVKLEDLRHNTDIRRLKGVSAKDLERTQRYHEFYLEIKEELKRHGHS